MILSNLIMSTLAKALKKKTEKKFIKILVKIINDFKNADAYAKVLEERDLWVKNSDDFNIMISVGIGKITVMEYVLNNIKMKIVVLNQENDMNRLRRSQKDLCTLNRSSYQIEQTREKCLKFASK